MKLTKSKIIVLLAMFLSTICMLISYSFIDDNAREINENYEPYDRSELIYNRVFSSTLPRYYELMKKQDEDLQPYELFMKNADVDNAESKTVAQKITDEIHNELMKANDEYAGIKYYLKDTKTEAILTNQEDEGKELENILLNGTYTEPDWYIAFSFDENGIMNLHATSSKDYSASWITDRYEAALYGTFNEIRLRNVYTSEGTYSMVFNDEETGEFQSPKNVAFVFAIDDATMNAVFPNDSDEYIYTMYSYQEAILPYYLSIVLGCGIFIFLCYRDDPKNIFGFRTFKKIPMEIQFILFVTLIPYVSEIGGQQVRYTMDSRHFFFFGGDAKSISGHLFLWGVENFLPWLLVFTWLTFFFIACKDMLKRHAWREYFITRKFLHWIKVTFKKSFNFLQEIDLTDEDDKRLFKAIAIHFMLIAFMITIWGFGYFFLLIYALVLFIFGKKYLKSIRHDYNNLLEVTKHIADGNLENEIETDLGIFNDFKNNMSDIRSGFKEAVEQEVHSQRMKTELITNVSHDLKTPLTNIITYIDLLKSENITEADRQKYMETLDRNSIRLKHLIDDLFEVSKANSGTMPLNCIDMDIVSLMKQVQVEVGEAIKKQKLHIKNNFSDEKIICHLDPQRMYRIFENLLSNIAKYAMKNTRVYVDITDYDTHVDILLRNISAVEMDFDPEDITDRFTRGDASRNTEGSGLGLAIAKSFTEMQGGTLRISIDGDLFKVHVRFLKESHD